MAKFELSLNSKYLPEWGVWEGVRELIQNGKDAETELDAQLTVDWKNGTLRIENEGATLAREALLFGTTSKMGRADLIGKFGEGLKLGVLALVRAGHDVTIRSGSEVWNPYIARSEKYDADVLSFDIVGNREDKKRVRVEIGGISESVWQDFRTRFLFLKDKRESDKNTVKTYYGDLLLHEKYQGKLYVKGIFVCSMENLQHGYNYKDAELDRDRKMIESYDRRSRMASILNDAVARRPDLLASYLDILEDIDSEEAKGVNDYRLPDQGVVEEAAKRFKQRYGDNAVPVRNLAEAADVEHFGCRGVVVTEAMAAVLKGTLGNAETTKAKFAKSTVKSYSLYDLEGTERANLTAACTLFAPNTKDGDWRTAFKRIDVVDYRDSSLQGLFHGERISIARKLLTSVEDTLEVLVHEFAHDFGKDGDKGHVSTIETFWKTIVKNMRKGN
jgi:hypothetical protein